MTTVVEFDNVSKVFPGPKKGQQVKAVDEVSLKVEAGSIVGVIGYSGAGKSTLVRLINGLEKNTGGSIRVLGTDVGTASESELRALRERVGMIFQQFNLFTSRTVRGNVEYALKLSGWNKAKIAERVDELLKFVGISDKAGEYPRRLSGGQKQRVGIARALATSPEILLADEATSALDPQTTVEVLELLRQINQELGTTIIIITHQISIVHELCDQVVVMENGRVVDSGEAYEVFANPSSELTERLVSSVVQGAPQGRTLTQLAAGGGQLLSVDINAEVTGEEVASVFRGHGIERSVVFGGITDVAGRPLGTLTYRLLTDQATAEAIADELQQTTKARVLVPEELSVITNSGLNNPARVEKGN
ncbi:MULTISPECIES: methionine ABC transporter ATP-binding protein [unclassified Pseudoclavibacter]|uniref:methionine ABC transporter ATP-binding protein n=1 Tax=unclassified Pseudoclavibacter TaxID=2615177 RepID=UPI001301095F|nr:MULTISPECIES: methionine ABC transporter ATP-binding protein [unclassified Pseudoclavibacter]KAB1644484.1 methionine ABC transporter ATP-binding protein [Pseudoclavibacter sp. CFCC 14310]KAB1664012.1 methionine ABC transporter ATP-binding protein [Pseudoclavibacter sp. CFCC 13611]